MDAIKDDSNSSNSDTAALLLHRRQQQVGQQAEGSSFASCAATTNDNIDHNVDNEWKKKFSLASSLIMFCIIVAISLHVSIETIQNMSQQQTTINNHTGEQQKKELHDIHHTVSGVEVTGSITPSTGGEKQSKTSIVNTTEDKVEDSSSGKLYCPIDVNPSSTGGIMINATALHQPQQQQLPLFYQWNQSYEELKQKGGKEKYYEYPQTQFTSHIESILSLIETDEDIIEDSCKWKFYFTLAGGKEEGSYPTPVSLHCMGTKLSRIVPWWCKIFKQIFSIDGKAIPVSNGGPLPPMSLPTNITIAISSNDKDYDDATINNRTKLSCLASSSPNGLFAITNFLELQRMADKTEYSPLDALPWNSRCPVPIWRGSAWMDSKTNGNKHDNSSDSWINATNTPEVLRNTISKSSRLKAVLFSKYYPTLLDARISDPKNGFMNRQSSTKLAKLWGNKATNGLDQLLPVHEIPSQQYYTNFQVSVVLCGLGASFRTSTLLSTATAVVIQDCPNNVQEWFMATMTPNVNYIPLKADLSNLSETMVWIQNHPAEVFQIAQNGHNFYTQYLSFGKNYGHIYELLYRISYQKLLREKGQSK